EVDFRVVVIHAEALETESGDAVLTKVCGKARVALAVEAELQVIENRRRYRPVVGEAAVPTSDPLQPGAGEWPTLIRIEVPNTALVEQIAGAVDVDERT